MKTILCMASGLERAPFPPLSYDPGVGEMLIYAYPLWAVVPFPLSSYTTRLFHGAERTVAPTCPGLMGSLNKTVGHALHGDPCRLQSPFVHRGHCVAEHGPPGAYMPQNLTLRCSGGWESEERVSWRSVRAVFLARRCTFLLCLSRAEGEQERRGVSFARGLSCPGGSSPRT